MSASLVRMVVLGLPCTFTRDAITAALVENDDDLVFDLAAILLAGAGSGTGPAWPGAVPVEAIPSRAALTGTAFRDRLAMLDPDLVAVACFPWRVPRFIRDLPRLGCVNVHPSLLPQGRGPDPVFWAFRWGLDRTGVTIHRLDAGFDTGPILAQRSVAIAGRATIPSLEAELAQLGGRLLHTVIHDLARGVAREIPQPPGSWPRAPFPTPRDFAATTAWPARRVAAFIRAVAPVHGPVPLLVAATGQMLPGPLAANDVVSADDGLVQDEPVRWDGDRVRVRCAPGVVTLRLRREPAPLVLRPYRVAGPATLSNLATDSADLTEPVRSWDT